MPIITLTTDFGARDGYVGAMKGVILTIAPQTTIIDIAHGIPAQDVAAGAVALAQAAPLYPPGTIHVAVIDPGVGGNRADILVEAGGHLYIGPDNGVLSLVARGPRQIFRIESPEFRRATVSPTFHGRDVFAVTAARLAAGARPMDAGSILDSMVEITRAPARRGAGIVEGEVIHVDGFGNLITSLPGDVLSGGSDSDVGVEVDGGEGLFAPLVGRTFSDVEPGALVAYVGSGGQVEIARRDGSAARRMDASRGTVVRVRSPAS
ncbi:MAG TPA: SAM-dependent chlorinase/fluorinase [Polyangia bacterium]|nr:SAM-dependent chlorinase/fluorinase [Polyangia bacterium]